MGTPDKVCVCGVGGGGGQGVGGVGPISNGNIQIIEMKKKLYHRIQAVCLLIEVIHYRHFSDCL